MGVCPEAPERALHQRYSGRPVRVPQVPLELDSGIAGTADPGRPRRSETRHMHMYLTHAHGVGPMITIQISHEL